MFLKVDTLITNEFSIPNVLVQNILKHKCVQLVHMCGIFKWIHKILSYHSKRL